MKTPVISIVIPTFNRAGMIHHAIDSVKSQNFEDWELIVVDDASTDTTEAVVKNLIKDDHRIKYLKQTIKKGGCASRNEGIRNSRGNYIAFLDDDDRWHPEKLKLQYNEICTNSDAGLIYCGFQYIDFKNNKVIRKVFPFYKGDVSSILIRNNIIGSATPLIKKECFILAGLFDVELNSCQDWDMWIRIAQHYKINYVEKILADITLHGHQVSTNLSSKIESRRIIINKYCHILKNNPAILSYHYKKLAVLHALNHSQIQVIINLLKAISLYPQNFGYLLHLFLCVFPSLHRLFIYRFGGLFQYEGITLYN